MSSTTRSFTPDKSQLIAGLGHVLYEIDMFLIAGSTCSPFPFPFLNNCVLESRLIHTRCLLDFFEKDKRSTRKIDEKSRAELDDILAKDFGFSPRDNPLAKHYRERLNQDLAHLSYARTERAESSKNWPLEETFAPFLPVLHDFLSHSAGWINDHPKVPDFTRQKCSELLVSIRKLSPDGR